MALGVGNHLQAGPAEQLGLNGGHLFEGNVGEQQNGVEAAAFAAVLFVAGRDTLQGHAGPGAHLGQGRRNVGAVFAGERQAEGCAVFSQKDAVTVIHFPA